MRSLKPPSLREVARRSRGGGSSHPQPAKDLFAQAQAEGVVGPDQERKHNPYLRMAMG